MEWLRFNAHQNPAIHYTPSLPIHRPSIPITFRHHSTHHVLFFLFETRGDNVVSLCHSFVTTELVHISLGWRIRPFKHTYSYSEEQPECLLHFSKYVFLYHLYSASSHHSFCFLCFAHFVVLTFLQTCLVPGMLAFDLPTLITLGLFLFFSVSLSVTTGFVSLQDGESGRTLGVLLISLGRKNGSM